MTTIRAGAADAGPTVRRMLLGAQLRRLREAKGLSRDQAGWHIRASESKISRMELGRVSFKERDVADLLTLYGIVDEDERSALLTLARQANSPGWWHAYGDLLPTWFQSFPGLESAASVIRTYEVQLVPGLLQTADYARAVIQLRHDRTDDSEIDRRVQLRLTRQDVLNRRPHPPRLWAVVDEAVLRRAIGGPRVMRAQIQHLIDVCERPNVQLQIVPFEVGGPRWCGRRLHHPAFPGPEPSRCGLHRAARERALSRQTRRCGQLCRGDGALVCPGATTERNPQAARRDSQRDDLTAA